MFDWERYLVTLGPEQLERFQETRRRMVADMEQHAEDTLIGKTWDLSGVKLYSVGVSFDARMEALTRELPVTWSRDVPMAEVVRVRPRLLRLHRRARTRRWAKRHGLLEEFLAVKYGLRFERPVTQVFNTVTIR